MIISVGIIFPTLYLRKLRLQEPHGRAMTHEMGFKRKNRLLVSRDERKETLGEERVKEPGLERVYSRNCDGLIRIQ